MLLQSGSTLLLPEDVAIGPLSEERNEVTGGQRETARISSPRAPFPHRPGRRLLTSSGTACWSRGETPKSEEVIQFSRINCKEKRTRGGISSTPRQELGITFEPCFFSASSHQQEELQVGVVIPGDSLAYHLGLRSPRHLEEVASGLE